MKFNKKTCKRINQDFKNLNEKNQKLKSLNTQYLKRLDSLSDLEYVSKKIRDAISNLNYKLFWSLKNQNTLDDFCLKTACKIFAIGYKNDYELRNLIKIELKETK